jgi:hypothetical protein
MQALLYGTYLFVNTPNDSVECHAVVHGDRELDFQFFGGRKPLTQLRIPSIMWPQATNIRPEKARVVDCVLSSVVKGPSGINTVPSESGNHGTSL